MAGITSEFQKKWSDINVSYTSNLGDLSEIYKEDEEEELNSIVQETVDNVKNGDTLLVVSNLKNEIDKHSVMNDMMIDKNIQSLYSPITKVIQGDSLLNNIFNGIDSAPVYFDPELTNRKDVSIVVKPESLAFNDYEIDVNNEIDLDFDVSEKLNNQFKKDYFDIFDDYMASLNNLMGEYLKELYLLADNNNISINDLTFDYIKNSKEVPKRLRYYSDKILFLQVKKNEASKQYRKIYNSRNLICITRSCKICLQEQQRILDLEISNKESNYIDSYEEEFFNMTLDNRSKEYRDRMRVLFQTLYSSLLSYEEIIKMDIEIKRNKAVLLRNGVKIY